MNFQLEKSIRILEHTPSVLRSLLSGLDDSWLHGDEGEGTWSPCQVVGHLISGEQTDWIPRAKMILAEHGSKKFEPFDRMAHLQRKKAANIDELLNEFADLRKDNLHLLRSWNLTSDDLEKTGIHPDFGIVAMSQLLATWTVHDLNHIGQIVRAMSLQYVEAVGPWKVYLGILNRRV